MTDDMRQIKVAHIKVRENIRSGELDVTDLAEDIRVHGLLQPILVRRCGEGYELVAGHRRLAACKQLKLGSIPAVITDGHDCSRVDMQLAENIQREDLSPYDVGLALRKLRDHVDSVWELSRRVRKSHPWVAHHLEYADLFEDLRAAGVDEALLKRIPIESLLEFKALAPGDRAAAVREIIPADPAAYVPAKVKIRKALEPRRVNPREKRKKALTFEIHQHGLVLAVECTTKLDVRRLVQILVERGGRLAS